MKRRTAVLIHLSTIPALGYLLSMNETVEVQDENPEAQAEEIKEAREEATNEVEPSSPAEEKEREDWLGEALEEGQASWDWDGIRKNIDPTLQSEHSPYISTSKSLAYMLSGAIDRWGNLDDGGRKKYRTWMGGKVFNEEMRSKNYTDNMKKLIRDGSYKRPNGEAEVNKLINESEIHQTLADYSVGYETACGNAGTGWFLDYEIPENGEYPTRWFMATAAQNLNNVHWEETPYRQYRKHNRSCGSKLTLTKITKDENNKKVLERDSVWSHNLFYLPKNIHGDIYKMEEEKWRSIHYMNDFAVLEINFVYEEQARKLTGNFYEKYHNTGRKRINFFSEGPGEEGLGKKYFGGGYRANSGGKTIAEEGYTVMDKRSGTDLSTVLKNRGDLVWNGKNQRELGVWYAMAVEQFSGTSGSLVVDSELNLLGLVTGDETINTNARVGKWSFSEPLKFKGVRVPETGELFLPKYDLLMGEEGQIGSYKEQLDTYLPDINTYLRSLWTKPVEEGLNSIRLRK